MTFLMTAVFIYFFTGFGFYWLRSFNGVQNAVRKNVAGK